MSRSVRMDYERYRTPTTLFPCYECATLTPTLPDASGVALCDQHQDKPAMNSPEYWAMLQDAAPHNNVEVDGYGFRI